MSTAATFAVGSFSSSFDVGSASNDRYNGLIKQSFSKQMTQANIGLFSFLDNYAPRMEFVHSLITFFRFMQFIGPAIMISCESLFDHESVGFKTLSIISILYNVVPPSVAAKFCIPFLIGSAALCILTLGTLFGSSFYYRKFANLPKAICVITSFTISIFGFILLPINCNCIGYLLSEMVMKRMDADFLNIFLIVLTLVLLFILQNYMINVYCTSLVFRPCSFMSILPHVQKKILYITMFVTLIGQITARIGSLAAAFGSIINAAAYVFSITIQYDAGSIIHNSSQALLLSGSFFGVCVSIISAIILFAGEKAPEFVMFIFLAIFIACYIVSMIMVKRKESSDLNILDSIIENDLTNVVNSPKKVLNLVNAGFANAHPVCLDYSIFKDALNEWQTDIDIWFTFSKFVSIYPENMNELSYILNELVAKKIKGANKSLIQQINIIARMREANLSPDVKSRVAKIVTFFNKTKNRIRNIWDLLLQGNVAEMASAVDDAMSMVDTSLTKLNHIIMIYPNNRFVARQAKIFYHDVIGNSEEAKLWNDKSNQLVRSNNVTADKVYEEAIIQYPNLPATLLRNPTIANPLSNMASEADNSEDFSASEYDVSGGAKIMKDLISDHKVPAVRVSRILTVLAGTIMFFIPTIFLISYFFVYKDDLFKPLEYLHGIAYIRHMGAMLSSFVSRLVLELTPDPDDANKPYAILQTNDEYDLSSFGGGRNASEQLKFILKEVSAASTLLGSLRTFKPDNERMNKIRNLVFGEIIEFYMMSDPDNKEIVKVSAESVAPRLSNSVSKLIQYEKVDASVVKSGVVLTPLNNFIDIFTTLNEAGNELIQYLTDANKNNENVYKIVAIVVSIVQVIFTFIIYLYTKVQLKKAERTVYTSFSLLPKTILSQVSASFDIIHGGNKSEGEEGTSMSTNEQDHNKQEDSIIKTFTSLSDGGTRSSGLFDYLNTLFFFIIAVIQVVTTVIICLAYINISDRMIHSSPHINYIFGTISGIDTAFTALNKIIINGIPDYKGAFPNYDLELERASTYMYLMMEYFQTVRYGGSGKSEFPFSGVQAAINDAGKVTVCANSSKPPTTITENSNCFGVGLRLYLYQAFFFGILSKMTSDNVPLPNDMLMTECWYMGPVVMYDTFYYPTAATMVDTVSNEFNSDIVVTIVSSVILMLLALIFMTAILYFEQRTENKIKYLLSLLVFCPHDQIIANSKIMALIGGQYDNERDDTAERDSHFFDNVVAKLSDYIFITNKETGEIVGTNPSFENLFEIDTTGMSVNDFFTSERFEGDIDNAKSGKEIIFFTKEDTKKAILFTKLVLPNNIVYCGRDKTTFVNHASLIADERKKSDQLLSSILPASLVPRVQSGEKDITFSVSSVSVLFLDIVEFTPWCGSNTATYVMKTLNRIFMEMDALVNSHKTLTRVKCIGDCYMAAGGIFDEINNPTTHAKEMVEFGREAINKITELNGVLNEKLRIRVGINTGGPIVAGVLGIDKPTFEILGPTINIAQQMEHNGIPMMVHISRPVYELVYSFFNIKERGEIEVKKGKMFTYLIAPRDDAPNSEKQNN